MTHLKNTARAYNTRDYFALPPLAARNLTQRTVCRGDDEDILFSDGLR